MAYFDGTGIRDYIHVTDLAEGHLSALKKLLENNNKQIYKLNLGSGKGHSVLEVIKLLVVLQELIYPLKLLLEGLEIRKNVADPSFQKTFRLGNKKIFI